MSARGFALRSDDGERLSFGRGHILLKLSSPSLTVWRSSYRFSTRRSTYTSEKTSSSRS
jgi:hypothetical protein